MQYADDLDIYISSSSAETAENLLQSSLNDLDDWLQNHNLSFSVPKCKVLVFTKKRSIPYVDLTVNDEIIPQDNSVKFLGV